MIYIEKKHIRSLIILIVVFVAILTVGLLRINPPSIVAVMLAIVATILAFFIPMYAVYLAVRNKKLSRLRRENPALSTA